MTLDQIYKYYEEIRKSKARDERLRALVIGHATAYGFGNLKNDEFNEFLEGLYASQSAIKQDPLERMKEMGLPVEEDNG